MNMYLAKETLDYLIQQAAVGQERLKRCSNAEEEQELINPYESTMLNSLIPAVITSLLGILLWYLQKRSKVKDMFD